MVIPLYPKSSGRASLPLSVGGILVILICLSIATTFHRVATPTTSSKMIAEASNFVKLLDENKKRKALFVFNDESRTKWHNAPSYLYSRKGISLKELSGQEKRALHSLLKSALSVQGYLKVWQIIQRDEYYREFARKQNNKNWEGYGHDFYWISFFGEPVEGKIWGWKFEGHHLSINFTVSSEGYISSTPFFLGANPASLPDGPYEGFEILPNEAALAWQLFTSLTESQKVQAILKEELPEDILTRAGNETHLRTLKGLQMEELNENQQDIIMKLVNEYLGNLCEELKSDYLKKLNKDQLYFTWIGGTKPGDPIYYRIQSPAFIFEFNNRSKDQNHIHTLWRHLKNDFGRSEM